MGDDVEEVLSSDLEEHLQKLDKVVDELTLLGVGKNDFGEDLLLDEMTLARLTLMQKAIIEMKEAFPEWLSQLRTGFSIRLVGLESLIGSFSSFSLKEQREGVTIFGMLEDLQDQITEIGKSDLWKQASEVCCRLPKWLSFQKRSRQHIPL